MRGWGWTDMTHERIVDALSAELARIRFGTMETFSQSLPVYQAVGMCISNAVCFVREPLSKILLESESLKSKLDSSKSKACTQLSTHPKCVALFLTLTECACKILGQREEERVSVHGYLQQESMPIVDLPLLLASCKLEAGMTKFQIMHQHSSPRHYLMVSMTLRSHVLVCCTAVILLYWNSGKDARCADAGYRKCHTFRHHPNQIVMVQSSESNDASEFLHAAASKTP
eukprot:1335142-Amphidinium_carterae.1